MNGFIPNIKCPHCNKHLRSEISGYGRTFYNSRLKHCKYCGKEYVLECFVTVTTEKETVADGRLSSILSTIKRFRKLRQKGYAEQLKLATELNELRKKEEEKILRLMVGPAAGSA